MTRAAVNPGRIRIGDTVVIDDPQIFVRCGYPLTKQDMVDAMTPEDRAAIDACLMHFNLHGELSLGIPIGGPLGDVQFAIARYLLVRQGFGGKERTIHTEERTELKGCAATVIGKRHVRTGTYASGWCYSEDGDYDPPRLDVEQTHTILRIDNGMFIAPKEIEASRVHKAEEAPKP